MRRVLEGFEGGPAVQTGVALGEAIGRRAVELRDDDGSLDIRLFVSANEPARWARTPPGYETSKTPSSSGQSSATPMSEGDRRAAEQRRRTEQMKPQ